MCCFSNMEFFFTSSSLLGLWFLYPAFTKTNCSLFLIFSFLFCTASSSSVKAGSPPKDSKAGGKKGNPVEDKPKEKLSKNKMQKQATAESPSKPEGDVETVEVRGVLGSPSLLLVEASALLAGKKLVVKESASFCLTFKSFVLKDPAAAVVFLGWGLGKCDATQALVLSYLLHARGDLRQAIDGWVTPTLIAVDGVHPGMIAGARKDATHRLDVLDQVLTSRTFLVGERLSLADLAMATTLLPAFRNVLDEEWRSQHRHLVRWWNTVLHQASLASLLGGIELATLEAQPMKAGAKPKEKKEIKSEKEAVPKAKKEVSPKPQKNIVPETRKEKSPQPRNEKSQPKKEKTPQPKKENTPQPKKEKTPQPKKEKSPQPEKEKSPSEKPSKECESKEVKPKSVEVKPTIESKKAGGPMDHLPMGSFDLEAWKRFYSNNNEESSCDYFWREFDPSCYSIWRGDYRFNSELDQVFMSCNLIGGMMQRLDKMSRHAFASCCLWGEAGKLGISGIWVFKGQQIAFEHSEDWQVDYASYDWVKLDPALPATRAVVNQYLRWEGVDQEGRKFCHGKIFK